MQTMTLNDYEVLYKNSTVTEDPKKLKELDSVVRVAITNEPLYQTVQRFSCVPWPVIAAIHFRESSQNFRCHLHNGDPLTARTTHVPKGRPEKGQPPFTWIESATDALSEAWRPNDWDVSGCLEFIERFNGLGYQRHDVHSPYLWNYTNQYEKGLYISDGTFDPEKIEIRPGCAAILKTMVAKGVAFDSNTFTKLMGSGSTFH